MNVTLSDQSMMPATISLFLENLEARTSLPSSHAMSSGTTYSLTSRLWPEDGILEVFDSSGIRLMGVSLEFLKKGLVLNWDYIDYALSCCTVEPGSIWHTDSLEIDRQELPHAGKFLFKRIGEWVYKIQGSLANFPLSLRT